MGGGLCIYISIFKCGVPALGEAKGLIKSRNIKYIIKNNTKIKIIINPLASPWEEVSVFTYLYLSAEAPALGEVKGLK